MTLQAFEKLNLPDSPGIYFWKQGAQILYIGKATSLRDRVRSYFSADLISTRGPRMVDMVFRADSIEWQETDSVLEALIAEANAIKKHQPRYNVQEKDDKSWNYVVVTRSGAGPGGELPRVLTIRGRTLDVEKQKKLLKVRRSFGPFTSGQALREALKIIRKMFPYMDKASSSKYSSNFYRQIGLNPETATPEAVSAYKKNIDHIVTFFEGRKRALIRELEREMDAAAKQLEFERAGEIKRKIFALEHIQDVALIKDDVESFQGGVSKSGQNDLGTSRSGEAFRIEAYDVAHMSGKETVGVMTVVCDGEPDKNEYRRFKLNPETGNNDVANLRETMSRRLSHLEWRLPDLFVIDGGQAQLGLAIELLKERNLIVPVVSVIKNDKHKPVGVLTDGSPAIDDLVKRHKKTIFLANSEAHRFAISYHRKLRRIRNPRRNRM